MSTQATFGQNAADFDLPALAPTVITVKGVLRVIYVQKIIFTPNAYAAATLSFSDSLTGVVIGVITIPATPGPVPTLDYGVVGTRLSAGASLLYSVSINGATGRLHLESYQKGR